MRTSLLKKKIMANLDRLPQPKIYEVVDFVEYLTSRKNNWEERFNIFLKKMEPTFKKISYKEIKNEVAKSRGK